MEDTSLVASQIVHLARIALTGRPQDIQLQIRRMERKFRRVFPDAAPGLAELLRDMPTRSSPLRRTSDPSSSAVVPVDLDTRLQLLRVEDPVYLSTEPVYEGDVATAFQDLCSEHQHREALEKRGLAPSRTVLLTGPPGVGKTLGARWLARQLGLPLMTLDLSAVMSSFLGRTGTNVRFVLDYAKEASCVLLLDEFDAIAKRRDDSSEVGELKRLVTVLLQEIDDWPSGSLMVAATNHEDLLDPAVWRRFDRVVRLGLPGSGAIAAALEAYFEDEEISVPWIRALSVALKGSSFSDAERFAMRARRAGAISGADVDTQIEYLLSSLIRSLEKSNRIEIAADLVASGALSQRSAHDLTGVSREAIRRHVKKIRETGDA